MREFHESSRLSPVRAYCFYICMCMRMCMRMRMHMCIRIRICTCICICLLRSPNIYFENQKGPLMGRARFLSSRMTYYSFCMFWFTVVISDPSITVTSEWARWRLKSPALGLRIVCTTVCSGADKKTMKALRHWPLWGEFTGDRWSLRADSEDVIFLNMLGIYVIRFKFKILQ